MMLNTGGPFSRRPTVAAPLCARWDEAMRDMSFHARGVFDHTLVNETGDTLPATPVAVAPQFRSDASVERSAPALGAHNDVLLGKTK
jgi:crotonobetainyl-CoA:carnitine CoA-transferase CaiB-like acyl-CoA transferase